MGWLQIFAIKTIHASLGLSVQLVLFNFSASVESGIFRVEAGTVTAPDRPLWRWFDVVQIDKISARFQATQRSGVILMVFSAVNLNLVCAMDTA